MSAPLGKPERLVLPDAMRPERRHPDLVVAAEGEPLAVGRNLRVRRELRELGDRLAGAGRLVLSRHCKSLDLQIGRHRTLNRRDAAVHLRNFVARKSVGEHAVIDSDQASTTAKPGVLKRKRI